jgi:hypothetical protein
VCLSAGSFSADQLSGNGVYYYSNGDIYSGGFRLGKKHGSGQMFFKVRARACKRQQEHSRHSKLSDGVKLIKRNGGACDA